MEDITKTILLKSPQGMFTLRITFEQNLERAKLKLSKFMTLFEMKCIPSHAEK